MDFYDVLLAKKLAGENGGGSGGECVYEIVNNIAFNYETSEYSFEMVDNSFDGDPNEILDAYSLGKLSALKVKITTLEEGQFFDLGYYLAPVVRVYDGREDYNEWTIWWSFEVPDIFKVGIALSSYDGETSWEYYRDDAFYPNLYYLELHHVNDYYVFLPLEIPDLLSFINDGLIDGNILMMKEKVTNGTYNYFNFVHADIPGNDTGKIIFSGVGYKYDDLNTLKRIVVTVTFDQGYRTSVQYDTYSL